MGTAASVHPHFTHKEALREDIVELFAEQFELLRSQDIERDELKDTFRAALLRKEAELFPEVEAKEDAHGVLLRSPSVFTAKTCHTFMVSVDGSEAADCAFKCALHLRRKNDNLVLFHTYKPGAKMESLPPSYRCEGVRLRYQTALEETIPASNYHLCFVERTATETVRGVLTDMVKLCRDPNPSPKTISLFGRHVPDYLVIGFSGRKNEMENCRSFMGSSTDMALRTVPIPIIIAKRECPRENKTYTYAVDGKSKSKEGLDVLLTLVMPRDTLIIIHVVDSNLDPIAEAEVEVTKRYYEEELRRAGPVSSRFMLLVRETGVPLLDCLVEYVNNEINPDFLVLAPRAKKQMASITEQVILKATASIILCKT